MPSDKEISFMLPGGDYSLAQLVDRIDEIEKFKDEWVNVHIPSSSFFRLWEVASYITNKFVRVETGVIVIEGPVRQIRIHALPKISSFLGTGFVGPQND